MEYMIELVEQLDIITYRANVCGTIMIVWEWENDLALSLHLQSAKIENDDLTRKENR